MREITLEELLEAGCHFGHQVTRHNPKSRDFVFEARDNIHIIDLAKTKEGLEEAAIYIKDLASKNGTLLVVGTKRQAQEVVRQEVKRAKEQTFAEDSSKEAGIHCITARWIGGILTNFSEVSKNIKKLKDLELMLADDFEKSKYTKKEIGGFEKQRQKLENFYGGIRDLKKIPDALFIIDTHNEDLAVKEGLRMGVTTVSVVDTNADPFVIDYPIPANDDAVGSIQLITDYIIEAWIEGRKQADKLGEQKTEKSEEPEISEKPEKAPKEKKPVKAKKEASTKSEKEK